jgi:hypothetical protein
VSTDDDEEADRPSRVLDYERPRTKQARNLLLPLLGMLRSKRFWTFLVGVGIPLALYLGHFQITEFSPYSFEYRTSHCFFSHDIKLPGRTYRTDLSRRLAGVAQPSDSPVRWDVAYAYQPLGTPGGRPGNYGRTRPLTQRLVSVLPELSSPDRAPVVDEMLTEMVRRARADEYNVVQYLVLFLRSDPSDMERTLADVKTWK